MTVSADKAVNAASFIGGIDALFSDLTCISTNTSKV